MISSYKITPQEQQTKQRQLNTCHLNRVTKNISSTSDSNTSIAKNNTLLESKNFKMTTLAADLSKAAVAAATANAKTMGGKPPMEAVVVNSIIYSKPSFCTIAAYLGSVPSTGDSKSTTQKPKTGNCPNNSTFHNEIDLNSSCWANLSVPPASADAKVYRMCTTINGSIHHQISDLVDNILATAEFFSTADNDQDDDILSEFGNQDDDNVVGEDLDTDEDDEEDEEDYPDDEDEIVFDDDDYDVVDFVYNWPTEPAPKLNCDKKKKVRFNTKPTVHVMHTWSYAYRAARKGEWEMYARDRERFKLRIQRAAFTLNPILDREHRQKVYEKRFVNLFDNDDDNDQRQQIDNPAEIIADKPEDSTGKSMECNEASKNESKKPHQKKKRRKKRYCKMGNKHYF